MIMELCNAGNLHNMLEDPENNYGFEEEDFKLILSHISKIILLIRLVLIHSFHITNDFLKKFDRVFKLFIW